MDQTNEPKHDKNLAEKDAQRESQQPYATEVQDRNLEKDHKDSKPSQDESPQERKPNS